MEPVTLIVVAVAALLFANGGVRFIKHKGKLEQWKQKTEHPTSLKKRVGEEE